MTRVVVLGAVLTMVAAAVAGPAGAAASQPTRGSEGAPPRVIGGQPVTPGQYPWLVAVVDHAEPRPYEGQFCGGTVVAPNWVLTAWHCVVSSLDIWPNPDGSLNTQAYYVDPSEVDVVSGLSDLTAVGGQRVRAAQIVPLPAATATIELTDQYLYAYPMNDMALIRLKAPLSAPSIRAATKADAALYTPPAQATVAGWGTTVDPGNKTPPSYPAVANAVTIPMQPDSACAAAYGKAYVKSGDLCAGAPGNITPGKDACYGDSGGPLAAQDAKGMWVQTGIVSFGGETCASNGKPGVYTRVSAFSDWLRGATGYGPFAGPGPFVAGQILDFANRRASWSDIATWMVRLQQTSPSSMILRLAAGPSSQATTGVTDRLYRAALGRAADTWGLTHWPTRLAGSTSPKTLADTLVASAEFRSRYGKLSDAAYVDHLYKTVLATTPTAANRATWLGRLRNGMSRGSVLVTFAARPAFTSRIAADSQITVLWFGMLRSAPTAGQVATWRGKGDALVKRLLANPTYLGRTWPGINDLSANPSDAHAIATGESVRRVDAGSWGSGALRVPR